MKLAVRGFVYERTLRFEEEIEIGNLDLDGTLIELGKQHAEMLRDAPLHMIEIEFMDEPDPLRFMRVGTIPDMAQPYKTAPEEQINEVIRGKWQGGDMPVFDCCVDCGVQLAGSWTRHRPECSFGQLIAEFGKESA